MEKKYFITSIVLIMFIASCSFTTVEQGQERLENQEDTMYYSHSYGEYSILLHSGPILWEHDTKIKV